MAKTFIGVRDVDEDVFRKFRSMSIEERMKLGEALTLAMRSWLNEKKKQSAKLRMPRLKPSRWGPGTERGSKEIDKILYQNDNS